MTLLLEKYGLLPADLGEYPAAILVTVFDAEHHLASLELAADLRTNGLQVALYPDTDKLARQFKYADKIRARLALVLGPDEDRAGHVTVKDLATGVQRSVDRARAAEACREALEVPGPK